MDMQKYLPPEGVTYEHMANGMTKLIYPTDGEWSFDAGLIDTMGDIICDTLAALAVSIVGYFSLKTHNHTLKKLANLPVDQSMNPGEAEAPIPEPTISEPAAPVSTVSQAAESDQEL